MKELHASIRLRPTRIAFLVRPTDRQSIRQIMQLNTCLWGGIYNPIILIFTRRPRSPNSDYPEVLPGPEITKGYINFFEPDVYVEAEEGLLERVGLTILKNDQYLGRTVIPLGKFMSQEYRGRNEPYFGQCIYDILRWTYNKERRFVLRDKHPAIISSNNKGVFAAACIGAYPETVETEYLSKAYSQVYKPEKVDNSPETWMKIYAEGLVTPFLITTNHIDTQRYWHEPIIYIYNETQSLDIIDLWNLRIEPNPLYPVPIQWFKELSPFLIEVIKNNYRPVKGNPTGMMHYSTVQLSRSIPKEKAQDMIFPTLQQLPQGSWRYRFGLHSIWRAPFTDFHGTSPEKMKITAAERQVRLPVKINGERHTQFETLSPQFAPKHSESHARWVNVVVLSTLSDHEIATVIPHNIFSPKWPRLGGGIEQVSITREGWVFKQDYKDSQQYVFLLEKDQAFIEWFKEVGINATLSECGRIAKQVLNSLQGLWGLI